MNPPEQSSSDEMAVRHIIESWARAISAGDRAGILAHHAPDLLMFDFPGTVQGMTAYDRTWDFFFDNPQSQISFIPRQLQVTSSADVAFASCLIHCEGTSAGPVDLRLTMGLRKVDGKWLIMHEHHSLPTQEERFIDPAMPSSSD